MGDGVDGASPALRASDADREQAAERLRAAAAEGRLSYQELDERLSAAMAAVTLAELAPLLADLPAQSAACDASATRVVEGDGGSWLTLALMGGWCRRGSWRLRARHLVLSLMGGTCLDLRAAQLSDQVTTMTVLAVMGGAHIIVPADLRVQVSRISLLGGTHVRLGDEQPPPQAPLLRLRLVALMGGVHVRRAPREGIGDPDVVGGIPPTLPGPR